MNRRQARQVDAWALADEAGRPTCGLCEDEVIVLEEGDELVALELCGRCNSAIQGLAHQVAAWGQPAPAGPVHVAGQLELDEEPEDAVCPTHGWTHRFRACADVPAPAPAEVTEDEEAAALEVLELGAILHALRVNDWTGIPTLAIADAVHHNADGFRADELARMRAVLRTRA